MKNHLTQCMGALWIALSSFALALGCIHFLHLAGALERTLDFKQSMNLLWCTVIVLMASKQWGRLFIERSKDGNWYIAWRRFAVCLYFLFMAGLFGYWAVALLVSSWSMTAEGERVNDFVGLAFLLLACVSAGLWCWFRAVPIGLIQKDQVLP